MSDERKYKKDDLHFINLGSNTAKINQKKSLVDKFRNYLPFFKTKEEPHESPLSGRIHTQLRQDAHQIVRQLENLKSQLAQELASDEGHLWHSFESVINPLLKEYSSIEKKLDQSNKTPEAKNSSIKSYQEWIEKTKLWAALSARPHDREGIIRAVVQHTIHSTDLMIHRDLKTLQEYINHEMHALSLDEHVANQVADEIQKTIANQIEGLMKLKHEKPIDLELEHVQRWKLHVTEKRLEYFEEALQGIDNVLKNHSPAHAKEEEVEHLKEVYQIISYLEQALPIFVEEVKKLDFSDKDQVSMMRDYSNYLEGQVNLLNQDLRLTTELVERVQALIKLIKIVHKYLKNS